MDDDAAAIMAIYAMLVYDVVAAICSSPQTAEINADKRAETLMKWVNLGLVQAGAFVLLGAYVTKGKKWPIFLGGGLAGGLLYGQYVHAKNAGLDSDEEGTED